MVFFTCDLCNTTVKKKQVDKHYARCGGEYFSCVDCGKTFGEDYKQHTECVREDVKYHDKWAKPKGASDSSSSLAKTKSHTAEESKKDTAETAPSKPTPTETEESKTTVAATVSRKKTPPKKKDKKKKSKKKRNKTESSRTDVPEFDESQFADSDFAGEHKSGGKSPAEESSDAKGNGNGKPARKRSKLSDILAKKKSPSVEAKGEGKQRTQLKKMLKAKLVKSTSPSVELKKPPGIVDFVQLSESELKQRAKLKKWLKKSISISSLYKLFLEKLEGGNKELFYKLLDSMNGTVEVKWISDPSATNKPKKTAQTKKPKPKKTAKATA